MGNRDPAFIVIAARSGNQRPALHRPSTFGTLHLDWR